MGKKKPVNKPNDQLEPVWEEQYPCSKYLVGDSSEIDFYDILMDALTSV